MKMELTQLRYTCVISEPWFPNLQTQALLQSPSTRLFWPLLYPEAVLFQRMHKAA
jgi:hypothetical protein